MILSYPRLILCNKRGRSLTFIIIANQAKKMYIVPCVNCSYAEINSHIAQCSLSSLSLPLKI